MKTLSIVIDMEGMKTPEGEKEKSPQEVTFNVIKNIILFYAQQVGLNEDGRYKYYKICDAFREVLKPSDNGAPLPETIELDNDWMELLKKCKKDAKMIPDKPLQRVEELIDAVK